MADLIYTIEANTFKPLLSKTSSVHDTVQCIAEHAPDSFSKKLRRTLARGSLEKATKLLLEEYPHFLPLLRTTTAVDVVSGGVKANALPENAHALVNVRKVFPHPMLDADRVSTTISIVCLSIG